MKTEEARPNRVVPLLTMFAGVALIAGALLLEPAFAASGADIAPDFVTLDTDANGTLTDEEWMKSAPASMMSADIAAAHYSMYDVDRNGSVTRAEYDRVNEEVLGEKGQSI